MLRNGKKPCLNALNSSKSKQILSWIPVHSGQIGNECIKSLLRISHSNDIVNVHAILSRPGGDGTAAENVGPDFAPAMGVFYDNGIQKAGFSYGTSY